MTKKKIKELAGKLAKFTRAYSIMPLHIRNHDATYCINRELVWQLRLEES